jgi:hypothetical protein
MRRRIAEFVVLVQCFVAGATLLPVAASTADLTKIERRLAKEPEYRSKSPRYCLLVFGPKAETRVWLVLDLNSEPWQKDAEKNILYVDRNGNGDLTESGERVACTLTPQEHHFSFTPKPSITYDPRFVVGEILERDGKTRHAELTLDVNSYVQDYRPCTISVNVSGRGKQFAGGRLLRFAERPSEAPIIHFNGPLAMRLAMETGVMFVPINYDDEDSAKRRRWYDKHPPTYEERKLVRGEEGSIYANLGTPGLGRGTFVSLSAGAPPADAHPVAEIAFPTADPEQPPATVRIALKQRC